ncbi:MAG: hypothetical protein L3J98_05685 [Gammaproteobacteria bacterium]|nr:hypothetical protein [Gammaproteobacteria bacterium]MCF6259640.1 hypothetical protein [Gammaproteobacteria bacterium]
MEVAGSTVAGMMRVGLQIISNHNKPVLEIYYELRNRFSPEQDIFIQFSIVNIGSVRAEDIELEVSGGLKRNKPRESLGEIMETVIPQMAPGQMIHLFRFDEQNLNEYPDGGGKSLGIKSDSFQITAKYNAPKSMLNWLFSLHRRIFGKKRYETKFIFKPAMVCGDLPPAEYT